jgi:hypothetical protein
MAEPPPIWNRNMPNYSTALSTRMNMARCLHVLFLYIPQIVLEVMHDSADAWMFLGG